MKVRGRRAAIAAGALAAAVLLGAGFLLRDEIAWWWRVRQVAVVTVSWEYPE